MEETLNRKLDREKEVYSKVMPNLRAVCKVTFLLKV